MSFKETWKGLASEETSQAAANAVPTWSRILSHGRITALPFSLASGSPFSIFIIPTVDSDAPIIVPCKMYRDTAASNSPFNVKCWTEPAIVEIPALAVSLTDYTVYWGAGVNVDES